MSQRFFPALGALRIAQDVEHDEVLSFLRCSVLAYFLGIVAVPIAREGRGENFSLTSPFIGTSANALIVGAIDVWFARHLSRNRDFEESARPGRVCPVNSCAAASVA